MKISGRGVDSFLRQPPPPSLRALLIYGPDVGSVSESSKNFARHIVPKLDDPFRVIDLTPEQILSDKQTLLDEVAALAFGGGRRLIRLRGLGDRHSDVVENTLEKGVGDGFILIEAGDLAARSSLRKLFEERNDAAAIACYPDEAEDIARIARDHLKAAGWPIEDAALGYLCEHLGADRLATRQELDKLVTYLGPAAGRMCSLADVTAIIGDASARDLDDLVQAVANGRQGDLDGTLSRLFGDGEQAISILRACARHFQRLHFVSCQIANGKPTEEALSTLRPPLFFKSKTSFLAQLRRWSPARIETALDLLLEAEVDCKSTGSPTETLTRRVLIRLARAAGVNH